MMKIVFLCLFGGLLICNGPLFAASQTVTIDNMKFNPAELNVHRGDRVTWTNKDLVPHTVTSLDGLFDSKVIDPGKSWTYHVRKTGSLNYKCNLHPTMLGALTVQ